MDVHDRNGGWDKKENPLISNFPLNLNIMPKLVLSCTERTLSFDRFFFSYFLWDVGNHESLCLHWPTGFSDSPIKTKGIFLIRKDFPFLLLFIFKIFIQIFYESLKASFPYAFIFCTFFELLIFLIPPAISLEFGSPSRNRCEFSSCFIIKTEDVILQMKCAECLFYDM